MIAARIQATGTSVCLCIMCISVFLGLPECTLGAKIVTSGVAPGPLELSLSVKNLVFSSYFRIAVPVVPKLDLTVMMTTGVSKLDLKLLVPVVPKLDLTVRMLLVVAVVQKLDLVVIVAAVLDWIWPNPTLSNAPAVVHVVLMAVL